MEIIRIDGNKGMNLECKRIVVTLGDKEYTLTERHGQLLVHVHDGTIVMRPCVSNEVEIDQED